MADMLRFVTADDPLFPAAAALRSQVLYEPLGLPGDRDFQDSAPNVRHLLALADDAVIGYGRLNLIPEGAQIRHLAVASSERGRRLGSRLVHELLTLARQEGCTAVWVNARFTALGFWRAAGFTDTMARMALAENTYVPHKRMEYRLS